MSLGHIQGRRDLLQADEFVPAFLETGDDFSNQSTLDRVRLQHDKRSLRLLRVDDAGGARERGRARERTGAEQVAAGEGGSTRDEGACGTCSHRVDYKVIERGDMDMEMKLNQIGMESSSDCIRDSVTKEMKVNFAVISDIAPNLIHFVTPAIADISLIHFKMDQPSITV